LDRLGRGEDASDPSENNYWEFELRGLSGNAEIRAIPPSQEINVTCEGIEEQIPLIRG